MNQQVIADLSAELIIKYYQNDYMPFLEAMDDDAMWYGPADGQFLHGKKAMIAAWNAEEHDLTFSLGNIEAAHISSHPSFCDVILLFPVTTHYPNDNEITLLQRILVCHISNLHEKHDDDVIYPNSFHEIYHRSKEGAKHGRRIHFHGLDRSDYFFLSDTIIRIEAAHGGKHSIIFPHFDDNKA